MSDDVATPSDAEQAEPTKCAHECSEESGCITELLDCQHEHSEDCGYTEAVLGTPCTFGCVECNAETGEPEKDACICDAPCTEETVNADCPVCGADGADLTACEGKPEQPQQITITEFDPLGEDVANQIVTLGEKLNLPDTLGASGYVGTQDSGGAEHLTIKGVTWKPDRPYDENAEQGAWLFTAVLPKEGYALLDSVELPEISVLAEPVNLLAGETGDFTVKGGSLDADYSYADNVLTIKSGTELTISGTTTTGRIEIADNVNAKITFNSLSIQLSNAETCAFMIPSTASADITLYDSNTLKSGENYAGLTVMTGGTVTIGGDGDLHSTGGNRGAGIGGGHTFDAGTINITGGFITAVGGTDGAGIGGGHANDGQNRQFGRFDAINITGGIINATTSGNAAAIGTGCWASTCPGTITIQNAQVTAKTPGNYKQCAAIGRGISANDSDYNCKVTIQNSIVDTKNVNGNTISGENGTPDIQDSIVRVSAGSESDNVYIVYGQATLNEDFTLESGETMLIPEGANLTVAEDTTLTNNGTIQNMGIISGLGVIQNDGSIYDLGTIEDVKIEGTKPIEAPTDTIIIYEESAVIEDSCGSSCSGHFIFAMGQITDNTIIIEGGIHNLILCDVNIDVSNIDGACAFEIKNNATVNLTLEGENTLKSGQNCAGLQVPKDTTLTITKDSTGSLTATGGENGAGIGGHKDYDSGTITIKGGTVVAQGGTYGAGIGGGSGHSGDTIFIENSTVIATGGGSSAGIGGGTNGDGGNITINSGNITANGGDCAAGIGGGRDRGAGGNITINGGTVTATAFVSTGDPASIGGGGYGDAGNIIINGGTVIAEGSRGIGSGGSNRLNNIYPDKGTLSIKGKAVIITNLISNKDNQNSWKGIVIENGTGQVYGKVTRTEDFEIPENTILTIPNGNELWLTNDVTMTNRGTIKVENGLLNYENGIINNLGTIEGNTITPNNTNWNDKKSKINFISPNSAEYGSSYDLTVEVSGENTNSLFRTTPKKTVYFYRGNTMIGSAVVNDTTKQATLSIKLEGADWKLGQYQLKATYTGSNDQLLPSETTSNFIFTVNKGTQTPPSTPKQDGKSTINSITLKEISTSGHGEVQYAYAEGANQTTPTSNWQKETTFNQNLKPGTAYTFFARYAEDSYYKPSESSQGATFYTLPEIQTTALDQGTVGVPYEGTLQANSTETVTWSADGLPNGWTVDSNGTITGTPTKAETLNFTVRATINGNVENTKSLSITIQQGTPDIKLSVTDDKGNPASVFAYGDTITIEGTITASSTQNRLLSTNEVELMNADGVQLETASVTNGTFTLKYDTGEKGIEATKNEQTLTINYGGSADLNPKDQIEVTITLNPKTVNAEVDSTILKPYDGKIDATVKLKVNESDLVNQDDDITAKGTGTYASAEVGNHTVNIEITGQGGDDTAWYDVKAPNGVTGEITKASAPTVNPVKKEYVCTVGSRGETQEVDIAALFTDEKPTGYSMQNTDTSSGIVENVEVDADGKLTFTVKHGTQGTTATMTVTATFQNYSDAAVKVEIKLIPQTQLNISCTASDVFYTGQQYVLGDISADKNYSGGFDVRYTGRNSTTYSSATPPTNVGEYKVTITPSDPAYSGKLEKEFTIEKATPTLTFTPSASELRGGGKVTLTLTGLPAGGTATVSCSDSSIAVTGSGTSWTATLPNRTAAYTFTANYSGDAQHTSAEAACTVSVTKRTSGGGSSSGGGGIEKPTGGTETVKVNPTTENGKQIVTVTIPNKKLDELVRKEVDWYYANSSLLDFGFPLETLKQLNNVSGRGDIVLKATQTTNPAGGDRLAWSMTLVYRLNGKDTPITLSGGRAVSVKLPYVPKTGEQTALIHAITTDGAGKVVWLDSSSYDADQKAVLFSITGAGTYGVGYKTPVPVFNDISGHWAEEHILFVASRGLLNGTGNDQFSPNTGMTRGMFVTALGRLAGINPASYQTGKFTDVAATAYYAPYVNWAAQTGIVNGTTETTFSPDSQITREQMAVMMKNYADKLGYDLPATLEAVTFTDNGKIGAWSAEAVKAMQRAGILAGKDNNRFDPQGTATRAEVATVLHRFVEIVIDPQAANGWTENASGTRSYYKGGKTAIGWLYDDKWYWLQSGGIPFAGGWKQIGGKWYFFNPDGTMAVNTTIDGYTLGPDGARK